MLKLYFSVLLIHIAIYRLDAPEIKSFGPIDDNSVDVSNTTFMYDSLHRAIIE